MSNHVDIEGRVTDWLEEESRGELPDWVLHATFHRTRRDGQVRSLRDRLVAVFPMTRAEDGLHARRGFTMLSTVRVSLAAILIGIVGVGLAINVSTDPAPVLGVSEAEGGAAVAPTPLLEMTLDGEAIPEEFVGVLFSRKTYPTDSEITYTAGFLPPNTFIRHVESGELGIRPVSDTQIIRAGSTWAEAEVVGAGTEALVGPGDTFVQCEVPWDEHGVDALGEMWTPGDDAVIVSIAIRERERCCSMSHPGMVSRWYHTLVNGVQELGDAPLRFRALRWEIPVGESMTQAVQTDPTIWAVDAGMVTARPSDESGDPTAPSPRPTEANSALLALNLLPDVEMVVENVGDEPAVLYQLLVSPAESVTPADTP